MYSPKFWKIIYTDVILLVLVTVFIGLTYVSVQQSLRQSANDPQIQLSEDASVFLKNGAQAANLLANLPRVDIRTSLATFLIAYDANGKVLGTSGQLDGQVPELPKGVLEYTQKNTQDRVTWEPKAGVRVAAVVNYFSGNNSGFILAGRSLREVEKRVSKLGLYCIAAWLFSTAFIIVSSFAGMIYSFRSKKAEDFNMRYQNDDKSSLNR